MPFEYAVRPFQSRDAHGRIILPAAPGGFDQRATLTWGAKTSLDSMGKKGISVTTHWPNDSGSYCAEESVQQTNQMATVSVANEGPNGGSVTFQRAGSIALNKDTTTTVAPIVQVSSSSASVLKNYDTLAAQMGVREPVVEHCGVTAEFNHV